MRLPPGPRAPALLQTIAFARSPQGWITQLAARYGDPFTTRTLIFGRQVFTSDPALIKEIFTGDPDVLHAGEANRGAEMITGTTSVLVLDGDAHLRSRRMLMPSFHGEHMHAFAETMRDVALANMATWEVGKPFSLRTKLHRITIEIIVGAVFGLPPGPRRDAMSDRLSAMMDAVGSKSAFVLLIPALRHDFGPFWPYRRLKALFDAADALIYEEIAARRALLARGDARPDDVLSMLIEARDEQGRGMSDLELRNELATLLAAGHETTATSLAWAFERILAHPAVYDRLVAEIDAAGPVSADALARIEYLDATVKEVMRQRPSVPNVGRKLTRPMVLRGYEIPAGTILTPSIYLTHQRPDLYPEPEAFRPERFLGKKADPYEYLPFGGGVRRCLGAAFAAHEMKIVLATVLARLRLQLVKTPPLKIEPRTLFPSPEGGTEVIVLGTR